MKSWKTKSLLLVVSLILLCSPTRPLGDLGLVLILPILVWSCWSLFVPLLTPLFDGVSLEYARTPVGYESDDPVADLIPAWHSVLCRLLRNEFSLDMLGFPLLKRSRNLPKSSSPQSLPFKVGDSNLSSEHCKPHAESLTNSLRFSLISARLSPNTIFESRALYFFGTPSYRLSLQLLG